MNNESMQSRHPANADDPVDYSKFAPKPLSARQTVIMTAEVLGGIALVMALLWWVT